MHSGFANNGEVLLPIRAAPNSAILTEPYHHAMCFFSSVAESDVRVREVDDGDEACWLGRWEMRHFDFF